MLHAAVVALTRLVGGTLAQGHVLRVGVGQQRSSEIGLSERNNCMHKHITGLVTFRLVVYFSLSSFSSSYCFLFILISVVTLVTQCRDDIFIKIVITVFTLL